MSGEIEAGAILEIERLVREADGKLLEIGGRTFCTRSLHNPPEPQPEEIPATLVFHTLQSLAEYARDKIDRGYMDRRNIFVHVVSPTQVDLRTGIFGENNQRACLAQAKHTPSGFVFGKWYDMEMMNILLQSLFEPTDGRRAALSVVGTVKHEAVQTADDTGTTQKVTAMKGIVTTAKVEVPNPIMLRPYRTFIEIDQPDSPFVLRMTGGGDKPLLATLIEADGGRWEIEAIKSAKLFLAGELAGVSIFG